MFSNTPPEPVTLPDNGFTAGPPQTAALPDLVPFNNRMSLRVIDAGTQSIISIAIAASHHYETVIYQVNNITGLGIAISVTGAAAVGNILVLKLKNGNLGGIHQSYTLASANFLHPDGAAGLAFTIKNGATVCLTFVFDGSKWIEVDGRPARGLIQMWSGSTASIPEGWVLCDGQNGTPNLRDRFIVGAGSSYAVGATGGSATHGHALNYNETDADQNYDANTVLLLDSGLTVADANSLPPYYALAFIMKL